MTVLNIQLGDPGAPSSTPGASRARLWVGGTGMAVFGEMAFS